ncbi:MAG: radical SAM protein [Ignisphaera sp.]
MDSNTSCSSDIFYARYYEFVKPVHRTYVAIHVPKRFTHSYYFSLFSKSPTDIVCPQFWELKWAVGCPYSCSYCFLQGTFYGNKSFRLKDLSRLGKELDEFLGWADAVGIRLLLNAGELCDSLAVPEATEKLIDVLKQVITNHPMHKILFVTKAGLHQAKRFIENVNGFEEFFVVSFSINAPIIAKRFEVAPPVEDRLRAAVALHESGIETRFRIDPMIPVDGWENHYRSLIEDVFTKYELDPERITIGSLRGLLKTIRFSKDREWVKYLKNGEKTGWGLKISTETRRNMYRTVIENLKTYGYRGYVSLCKETYKIWLELFEENLISNPGTPEIWENVMCNCRS